jgi:hypothetical protein
MPVTVDTAEKPAADTAMAAAGMAATAVVAMAAAAMAVAGTAAEIRRPNREAALNSAISFHLMIVDEFTSQRPGPPCAERAKRMGFISCKC